MNNLIQKLQFIKAEKNKITPDILKSGVTAFGITGELLSDIPFKIYNNEEEMNADTEIEEGQLGLIYGKNIFNLKQNDEIGIVVLLDSFDIPDYHIEGTKTDWGTEYPSYSFSPVDGTYEESLYINLLENEIRIGYNLDGEYNDIIYKKDNTNHFTKQTTSSNIIIFNKILKGSSYSTWNEYYSNVIQIVSININNGIKIVKTKNDISTIYLASNSEFEILNSDTNSRSIKFNNTFDNRI